VTHEVSPTELGQLYLELHHAFHRQLDEAMSAVGVSMARAKVLKQLSERGPMNQAAIAVRLGVAPRSVTDTVDGLEREGLAARRPNPDDRRAWVVEITPAGATVLAQALKVKKQAMNQIFGAFDAPTRAEFAALLTSMRDRLAATTKEEAHVQ
jgi:DNA-binding MarR family transcriptional regulator